MSCSEPPLALTLGEPAGIGQELALKAWLARTQENVPPFFFIANSAHLDTRAALLKLPVPLARLGDPSETGRLFASALPVLDLGVPVETRPGVPHPDNAPAVIEAVNRAVALVRKGQARALVTNPIHKKTLLRAGFAHAGHTGYLEHLARAWDPSATAVMMLTIPGLRVVPVTGHLALREACATLSTEAIVTTGKVVHGALIRDFGIARPRLAVAALNPHAGEEGELGEEERTVIAPGVEALRASGIDAAGPFAADTLFSEPHRRRYDAALCMYHDQALLPLKTLDFARGVNITLGLPFVRTSPDHGTAFDLAARGEADPQSLIQALKSAAAIARQRAP